MAKQIDSKELIRAAAAIAGAMAAGMLAKSVGNRKAGGLTAGQLKKIVKQSIQLARDIDKEISRQATEKNVATWEKLGEKS